MKKRIFRSLFLVSILLTLFCISFNSSWAAEKYPSRPIEFVTPWPPGGVADLTGRACARHLSNVLGVTVVPVNKPGASAIIGTSYVLNSPPDGYTILFHGDAYYIEVIAGRATFKFEDVRFIGKVLEFTYVIAVPADSRWKTFQELMDYARKNPGLLTYGAVPGAGPYICMEYLKKVAKLSMGNVPFKGDIETAPAILGKHVPLGCLTWTGVKPLVDAGKLRILFSFGPAADFGLDPSIPDWPTLFKDMPAYTNYLSLAVRAKTPDEIVKVLEQATEKMTKAPEFIQELKKLNQSVNFMDGKTFTEKILPWRISLLKEILKGTESIK